MPLTPSDVANKQFKVAFRGYSLDEVDAFLDEVESEIARLMRENSALQESKAAAPPEPVAADRPLDSMEGQEAALRTLLLAQRTADEAVAEARAEAAQIVAAAREQAEQALAEARAEADSTLAAARAEAEQTVAAARTEAQTTLDGVRGEAETTVGTARSQAEQTLAAARAEAEQTLTSARTEAAATLTAARGEAESTRGRAREEAARAEEQIAARLHSALGDLDERRQQLAQHIEQLRAFETGYRTRLTAHLRDALDALERSPQPGDGAPAPLPDGVAPSGPSSPPVSAVEGGLDDDPHPRD